MDHIVEGVRWTIKRHLDAKAIALAIVSVSISGLFIHVDEKTMTCLTNHLFVVFHSVLLVATLPFHKSQYPAAKNPKIEQQFPRNQ